jgi:hypothetical protein
LRKLIAALALVVLTAGGAAWAQNGQPQMFTDRDMGACWTGKSAGCEAWSRAEHDATLNLICRKLGKEDRCMPAEQAFDISHIAGPAANLVRGGSADEKRQNRFNLVLFIGRAADRARAARSDLAIEALRATIAESVPENIRWDSLRETLKEEGL